MPFIWAGGESMPFSNGEKIILLMLSQMQEHLKIEDTRAPLVRQAIETGNVWAIEHSFPEIFDNNEIAPDIVSVTRDVLTMWLGLEESFAGLSSTDKEWLRTNSGQIGDRVAFPGFSANYEIDYLSTARFIVNVLGEYEHFAGRDLNHSLPHMDTYRRMLPPFQRILNRNSSLALSAQEIAEVFAPLASRQTDVGQMGR
jgi:uncharacterized protein YfbU (UPF0304 family)